MIFYKRTLGPYYGNQYYSYNVDNQTQTMISIGPNSETPNCQCYDGSIGVDPKYFVFSTCAIIGLVDRCSSEGIQRNQETGEVRQIAKNLNGTPVEIGDGAVLFNNRLGISDDGGYVVFPSVASNIVENDTNNIGDLFVYNIYNNTTKRITNKPDGNEFSEINKFIRFTSEGGILFGTINSSGGYLKDIYSYDIVSSQVSNWFVNSSTNIVDVSEDGNRILYWKWVSTSTGQKIGYFLYDKKINKEILIYRTK